MNDTVGIRYRPDIDGLRALAVLSVVMFHAFPEVLPGGFIGVDIFFVISGYLITLLLLKNSLSGAFSFVDFYAKRILRIFPALFLLLSVVYIFAWYSLLAIEFSELGAHIAAGACFSANLLLWQQAGYFDAAARAKPLLHLWSLGVEEQFYIAWPILLLVLLQVRRGISVLVIAGLLSLSFAWSVYQVATQPVAAYFSPFSRFWELAIGGFLASQQVMPGMPNWKLSDRFAHGFSALGLILILSSCFWLNESVAFPGKAALPAVIGSAAIIAAGPAGFINRVLLSARPLVAVGVLSYGFYLWHWPILSFCEILNGKVPSIFERCMALFLALLLAWCSLHGFENKIRYGPRRRNVLLMLFAMLMVAMLGYSAYKRNGLPRRAVNQLNPSASTMTIGRGYELADLTCPVAPEQRNKLSVCWSDRRESPRFAVWGDSKADSLFWGLLRTSVPGGRWLALGRGVPIVGDESIYRSFQEVSRPALQVLLTHPEIKVVVLTTALRVLFAMPPGSDEKLIDLDTSPNGAAALLGLDHTINMLQQSGKEVVLVVDNPTLPEPRKCLPGGRVMAVPGLARGIQWPANEACTVSLAQHLKNTEKYRRLIAELQRRHPLLQVYDPTPILCPGGSCSSTSNGQFFYWKTDHISDIANEKIGAEINQRLSGH